MKPKQKIRPVKLTAEMIEAFAGLYLSPRYDRPVPTPDFHREGWELYCSDYPACDIAAPRGHAKSTSFTHVFCLANVCFRVETYVIIIGSSEEKAIEHLGDIANELRDNEELRRDFKIKELVTDQKHEIIVECEDGWQFRIVARGAEQKIRGTKWRGARPGLILGDDLEDDEQVENKDRRIKFRRWFFRACKQALRRGGRIRVHGTILHVDSLLARLQRNRSWKSLFYKAHKSYNDFSEILWPGMHTEASLRAIRQEFINEGDSSGYSQEYLNTPLDNDDKFIWESWFLPMRRQVQKEIDGNLVVVDDYEAFKQNYCGVDFAISKADTANRTSFTVGGRTTENLTCVVDQRVGRLDTLEIVEEFFSIQERWGIRAFFVEDGQIWKAVKPVLEQEMMRKDVWLMCHALTPIKDKKTRGQPFRKMMKAGGMRFDIEADWYPDYKEELLMFTGDSEAMADDQFDSTATLCMGLTQLPDLEDDDALTEEEQEFEAAVMASRHTGRSEHTGY